MNIRVFTPFSREENKEVMIHHLRKFGVIWHPILDKYIRFPEEPWIQPFVTELKKPFNDVASRLTDKFFHSDIIVDEDYYASLNDDDFWEEGFLDKIKHCTKDIIIVSMKRGDHVVGPRPYGTNTLYATPNETRSCCMGGEQLIMKGKVIKTIILPDSCMHDAWMIGDLYGCDDNHNFGKGRLADQFEYVPNAHVLFNYLEPGRYDNIKIW